MTPAIPDVSARQYTGGPTPVPVRGGNRNAQARRPELSNVEVEIASLLDRSTQELRHLWHKWHRTEPPLGLSRDLLIRALAYDLQKRTHGGPSAALRRRMRRLEIDLEKGALSVDASVVTKTGTTLLRAWRGQIHTVLVQKDGFEYEGQRYRSLTVIAERITGAHWSGPRFFGLTGRARTPLPAETHQ